MLEEVGNAGLYFFSELPSGVTGERHHLDCGYHSVATTKEEDKIVGITPKHYLSAYNPQRMDRFQPLNTLSQP